MLAENVKVTCANAGSRQVIFMWEKKMLVVTLRSYVERTFAFFLFILKLQNDTGYFKFKGVLH